jgi:hypothetical protein
VNQIVVTVDFAVQGAVKFGFNFTEAFIGVV